MVELEEQELAAEKAANNGSNRHHAETVHPVESHVQQAPELNRRETLVQSNGGGPHTESISTPAKEANHKPDSQPLLNENFYTFRRKIFILWGGSFDVFNRAKQKILKAEQKPFRAREVFTIMGGNKFDQPTLSFTTDEWQDQVATYRVKDETRGEFVGAIKRQAPESKSSDKWVFYSPDGKEIGSLVEKSTWRAVFSRIFGGTLVPQHYQIKTFAGTEVAQVKQRFNLLELKYDMNITQPNPEIDRRLLVSMGVLLAGIEKRQGSESSASSHSSMFDSSSGFQTSAGPASLTPSHA